MIVNSLFPTPVGFFELGRDLTKAEIDIIKNQPKRRNTGNFSSADNYVLNNNKGLKNLKKFFEDSAKEFLSSIYQPQYNVDLRITQSWTNYTEPGEFHHKHSHPNSFISGSFYVNADEKEDKIYFFDDGYKLIKIQAKEFNSFNSSSWWFSVKPGMLVIFPSSLSHMVEVVTAKETRISLAFNTFPVGVIGENNELTELLL